MMNLNGTHVLILDVTGDEHHETVAYHLASDIRNMGGIPVLDESNLDQVSMVFHYVANMTKREQTRLEKKYPNCTIHYAGDVLNIGCYRSNALQRVEHVEMIDYNNEINLHAAKVFEEYADKLRKGLCRVDMFDDHTQFTSGVRAVPSGIGYYTQPLPQHSSLQQSPVNLTSMTINARLIMCTPSNK